MDDLSDEASQEPTGASFAGACRQCARISRRIVSPPYPCPRDRNAAPHSEINTIGRHAPDDSDQWRKVSEHSTKPATRSHNYSSPPLLLSSPDKDWDSDLISAPRHILWRGWRHERHRAVCRNSAVFDWRAHGAETPAVRAAMEANREERTISRCEFRSIVIAERRRWSHRASCARKIYE
jgi:hypothetical protein